MLSPASRVRALVQLCGVLGGDTDAGAHGPPWEPAAAMAREHLLEGALWIALQAAGRTEDVEPGVARTLLWAQRRTALAEARFRNQALEAITALNSIGVVPVVLKGGAFVLDGAFPVGARAMHDIDLLVAADEMAASVAALETIDYCVRPNANMESGHERVLARGDRPGPLELHFELGERPVTDVLSTSEVTRVAVHHGHHGARWRCLTPTHALLHNILHSQLQDLNHVVAGIPVRQLYTYVVLGRGLGAHVDWPLIAGRLSHHGLARVHAGHSDVARRLFGFVTPAVPSTSAAALHSARCLLTFAVPGAADVQRNLRFAFDPAYLHHLYGSGATLGLAVRHGRTLLRERGRDVVRESLVPRGR